MPDIRPFIESNLLEPLKHYPTVIQDTMLEIIIQKLQALYDYATAFPEIVSPNSTRLDILKAIADQFLFTVREDADIQEQIDILDRILYVYNRRGSIDTIENMWKYYGGTLPKDVKVIIPSYNLFRYSISALSGNHVFQDNTINRTGVYEIRLTNNTYPIPDLREFLIKELVAAGSYFYFTNALHMDILGELAESYPYEYLVDEETYIEIQMPILKSNQGLTWSGYNPMSRRSEDSAWSGRGSIFLELTKMTDISLVLLDTYKPYGSLGFYIDIIPNLSEIVYPIRIRKNEYTELREFLYCTPTEEAFPLLSHSYSSNGVLITSRYTGYFIVGETPLAGDTRDSVVLDVSVLDLSKLS